jgi:PAS domain S-box-containing protein
MRPDDFSAEEQLRLSEASFRALIEESPDAFAVHREGRFVYVNRRGVELLGYDSPADLIGQPVTTIVHPDHLGVVVERLRALESGSPTLPFTEEQLVRRDGTPLRVEIAAIRVVFQGEPAVVAIARDVSERTRRHAEAAQAERMAAIGLLAAGVAHEINNPLTFVMLHLENLARTVTKLRDVPRAVLPGEWTAFAKAVDEARFGLERVGSIVRDLRTFARHDDGEPELVSIARVLDTAINLTAHELKYRAKVVRRGDESQAYVVGREGKLCQVFVNLLVNAAQALSDRESDRNEVVLETRLRGDSVCVTVTDTGRGIPPALLGTLFEPFVTSKGTGSGLGLSISRDIVTAHGGQIAVTNGAARARDDREPGAADAGRAGGAAGASFTVTLPQATEQALPRSSRNLMAVAAPVERARVLVIDDEPSIVSLVAAILSETYDLEVARSGVEAQKKLESDQRFDLILCDVMMPQLCGAELRAWLERAAPELATRMLFMSGGDLTSTGELADLAPDRFLAKPFTRSELESRVAKTLAKLRTAARR